MDAKDIYDGKNMTEQLFRKVKAIVAHISQKEGISIQEATEKYEKTEHYQKLTNPDTHMWEKPEQEIVMDYIVSEKKKELMHEHQFPSEEKTYISNDENPTTDLLENYHCVMDDIDFGPTIKAKAKQVAQIISSQKGLPYDEVYQKYIYSQSFRDLEDFNKHMLIKSEAELAILFLNELEGVKEENPSPKRI